MKKQPNKRNKKKKTYKEITMEKQANTCKIVKKQPKEKHGKQIMRMITVGTRGEKTSAKEIGSALKTGGENLSETQRAAPTQSAKKPIKQTNKTGNKQRRGKG
jgi:hypothetical protein